MVEMPESQSVAGAGLLVLGLDTCGPLGTVALARIEGEKATGDNAKILGQKELAGRTYSTTLVAAVRELLVENGLKPGDLGAFVVVSGPGSFTGVRVGLSAVKGLAEPGEIPVVAVSRLAVLAGKAGVESAALDAHRREVFLQVASSDGSAVEMLAGAEELAEIDPAPDRVALCDEEAAVLLGATWLETELIRVEAPTAADAIRLCVARILTGGFEDLGRLDGHYLRRSDAEIFGGKAKAKADRNKAIVVRRMNAQDLNPVMEMAAATHHAPKWSRESYEKSLDVGSEQRRVALIATDATSRELIGFAIARVSGEEAELESIVTSLPHRRRGVARELFAGLKNELRGSGVVDVILEVRDGNRAARGFYRSLGFGEEGRRPSYYSEPVEDAILLRLALR